MIQYNDRLLPDVGKCFKVNGQHKFTCKPTDEYEEVEIGEEVIEIIPNHFILGNKFEIKISPKTKKNLISKLFSNDDQIAIMLNYQASKTVKNKEIYNLMQGWRDWFSFIIKYIKELNNEQ